jgi:hypothetical protein
MRDAGIALAGDGWLAARDASKKLPNSCTVHRSACYRGKVPWRVRQQHNDDCVIPLCRRLGSS